MHEQMIISIQLLPEICPIKIWTEEQKAFLQFIQMEWEWIGRRMDYLIAVQAGNRPSDPLDYFYSPIFDEASDEIIEREKEDIRVNSNYLFALFQVIIENWILIESEASKQGRNFEFFDPKAFFPQICRQIANSQIEDAINNDPCAISGVKFSQAQQATKGLGRFCRATHPEQHELTREFLHSPWWGEFVLATVSQIGKKYLTKSFSWNLLLHAQKERECLVRKGKGYTRICLFWHCGSPVSSQNGKKFTACSS
jgi:hypothetical protein